MDRVLGCKRNAKRLAMASLLAMALVWVGSCDGVGGSVTYICYGNDGSSDTCRVVNGTSRETCQVDEMRTFAESTCPEVDYTKSCGDYFVQADDNCL